MGHFEQVCRSRQVQHVQDRDESEEEYVVVPYVVHSINSEDAPKRTDLQIDNHTITFTIDTGAQVNILCEKEAQKVSGKRLTTNKKLFSYGPNGEKQMLPILNKITTKVKSELTGETTETDVYILKGEAENLLSKQTSERHGLVTFANIVKCDNSSASLKEEFKWVFTGMCKIKDTSVKLHIREDVTPVQQKARIILFHI